MASGWLGKIFSAGAGSFVESVGNTLDKFITSKEEKAALMIELEKVFQGRLSEIEQTTRAELDVKARIIEAEMKQDDSYTKRARPTIIYVGLAIAFLKIVFFPLIVLPILVLGNADSMTVEFIRSLSVERVPMEQEFWFAWTGVTGMYAFGRSREKMGDQSAISQAMTGNGKGLMSIFDKK
jgi:hypothetical protein